ncbi:MAG: ComEC/Rec2 family competence protein [Clostridia bacterium]|nr:ComEC/Rec2 family competence protein [Clostridia bacterium]
MKTERPLFKICAVFGAFSFLCSLHGLARQIFFFFCAAFFAFCLIYFIVRRERGFLCCLGASALLACMISVGYFDFYVRGIERMAGGNATVECRVTETGTAKSFFTSCTVKVTSVDGRKVSFKARLVFDGELDVRQGDVLSVKSTLSPVPESENGFNSGDYYRSKGILLFLEASESQCIGNRVTLLQKLNDLARTVSARFEVYCGSDEGGLASALLLGLRDELPERTESDFRRLGISHILAVSGMHLTIIISGIDFIIRLFTRKKYVIIPVDIIAALFFALITGLHYSVLRASIMMCLYVIARETGRMPDSLTSLSFAAALIILFSPSAVTDCGFLLSFAAVLGLVAIGGLFVKETTEKRLNRAGRFLRFLLCSVFASMTAVYFTLPVMWRYFGSVSLASPLSNLIFIPLAEAVLAVAAPAALLSGTVLIRPLGFLLGKLCRAVLLLAAKGAEITPKPLCLEYAFVPFCILLSVAFMLAVIIICEGKKRRVLLCFLPQIMLCVTMALCYGAYGLIFRNSSPVAVANVKENDFVSFTSGGKTVFIDVSDGSYSNSRNSASACLSKLKDTDIDVLVFTHLHTKHISLFGRLTELYHIGTVVLPDDGENGVYDVIADDALKKGISVAAYAPEGGGLFLAGDVTLGIYPSREVKNRTHGTICFSLTTGESAAFVSRTATGCDEPDAENVFVLSHGGTNLLQTDVPQSWIAMNAETAANVGLGTVVNSGRTLAVYSFRLSR